MISAPLRPVLVVVLVALLAPSLAAPPSLAAQDEPREEILSYDVDIRVEADGWMEVTEEIRVRSLGEEIRRGIYRDFPTTFPRAGGFGRLRAPFEVVRVLRNGEPEPYVLQSVGGPSGRGGTRVRIGEADVFLPRGEHTFTVVYRTVRWIEYGEEADRLYWNVTGHGWGFPILEASADVRLPEAVDPDSVTLEAWTGPEGSTESDADWIYDPGIAPTGMARFVTTAPLGPREGLTIRVTFPKGVVAPPTEEMRARWFRMDWGPWLDSGLIALLVLSVYLLLWHRVGRDPSGRPVVVRYEPPEGFSAPALGYVVERGYHTRQLSAAVVDLAVRGWLEIEREGREWILRRTDRTPDEPLPKEEERLLDLLVGASAGSGRTVTLEGASNETVRAAVKAFKKILKHRHESRYFVLNRKWFGVGLLVTVVGFAALAWRVRYAIPPEGWFMGFWLTFWTMGTGTLLWRAAGEWKLALSGDALSWVSALFLTLFSIPFVGAELFVGYMLWRAVPLHLMGAAVVLGAVNVLFYHLLERPTMKGRGVLDEAEGFRAFLTSTERDRIRRLQPADASLELFERWLPWAIALDVESEWAERFEGALDSPAARRSAGALAWYSGDGGSASLSGLSSSLGGGLSSSLSASSAAPSSSGGGGGGSSGGGGGGGGGGGW